MDYSIARKQAGHTGKEEKEFLPMDTALHTLFNKGFLTKIEYSIMARIRQLDARKIALYNIITSKHLQDPMNALEMFKILTSGIQEEAEPNMATPNFEAVNIEEMEVNSANVIRKNPLLINTVIHNICQFLPLNELKKCRLVNQQWNMTAGPFLRKRSVVHFKRATGTSKLTTIIRDLEFSFPDLPLTAFRFSFDGVNIWDISKRNEFFEDCGHNIKSLVFRNIFLRHKNCNLADLDVTSWIAKANNLTKLTIDSKCTTLNVDLDILRKVESISLNYCAVFISYCSEKSLRIALRDLTLNYVRFLPKGQPINYQICWNDVIDFSFASKIDIRNTNLSFDLSSDVLNAKSVYLDDHKNWDGARGKVDSLFLCNLRLIERNNLEFKELTLKAGTIDMSIIPPTIEKLRFLDNTEIVFDYSLQLINLKFLGLVQVSQPKLEMISRFTYCANLKEVELVGYTSGPPLPLNVGVIPKSVKKLKITNVQLMSDGHKRQLNTLIIEESNFKTFFNRLTQMICNTNLKVNVLVMSCLNVIDLNTSDIISFVNTNMGKNKTFEKFVIGVAKDFVFLNINQGFGGSVLSRNVDKESNYYQFTNKVGKAITAEQFFAYKNIDGH